MIASLLKAFFYDFLNVLTFTTLRVETKVYFLTTVARGLLGRKRVEDYLWIGERMRYRRLPDSYKWVEGLAYWLSKTCRGGQLI